MGKVNRNIRAKAKQAVSKIREGLHVNKNILHSQSKSRFEDKIELVMHKTLATKTAKSKKEKYREKHKNLLQKFALIKKQRKEEKARKNREKTAVIGDLKPLKDALPSLDELFQLGKDRKEIKTGVVEYDNCNVGISEKLSVKQKLRTKKKQFVGAVNSYEALLNDPDFKKNPRDVISYHIKYKHGLIDE